MLDLVIDNGRLIDGTGAAWTVRDLGISNGRIAAIGKLGQEATAERVDATDRVVCPGFVDAHSHSELAILDAPRHEPRVMQGVTTEALGMCGLSVAPGSAKALDAMRDYFSTLLSKDLAPGQSYTVAEFLRLFDRRSAVNVAYCAPHATLRAEVAGMRRGPLSQAELGQMKDILAQALHEGACGMSAGLMYFPSSEADTAELIELCKVVAKHAGVYTTHQRDYGDDFVPALEETIAIGRETGVSVHIAHFRPAGKNKGKAAEILSIVDRARREGVDLTLDCYPYLMGCTMLSYFVLAMDAYDGGKESLLAKLRDPSQRLKLKRERPPGIEKEVFISTVKSDANRHVEGRTLEQLGRIRGQDFFNAACDLLIEEGLNVSAIGIKSDEDDLRKVLQHPACMIGSDCVPVKGRCHPRVFGAFSRFLDVYVLGERLMPLEEGIRKMTSFPALKYGLADRGILRPGMAADVVVFDPARLKDRATYENPRRHPEGFEHVIVNGEFVVRDGQHTGATPGRALK